MQEKVAQSWLKLCLLFPEQNQWNQKVMLDKESIKFVLPHV